MTEKRQNDFDKVAAIIGKPGLYTLEGVSPRGFVLKPISGSGVVFVSVTSKKVMLLKDLGIYTLGDTTPLKDVLIAIKQKEEEGATVPDENSTAEELFKFLEVVVPDYDQTRVKPSDVKKIIRWYKILKENSLLPEPDRQDSEAEDKSAGNPSSEEQQSARKKSAKKSNEQNRGKKK